MGDEGSERRAPEIRLTPPPRVDPVGSKLGRRRGQGAAPPPPPRIIPPVRRGRPWWAAPLALGLLAGVGLLALVLFGVGEGRAPSREPGRAGTSPAPTTAAKPDDVGEGLVPSREPVRAGTNAPQASDRAVSEPKAKLNPAPTTDTDFGRAMAAGLAALDAGDWQTARDAFTHAAAIDPASPEPAAGLERVERTARRAALEAMRQRASALLEAEAWDDAAAEYRSALETDPTLTFAREGLRIAEARATLSDRLAYHLDNPARLTAPEVLDEVDRLLERAREIERPGPRHAAQVAALEELAAGARVPVRVALLSDEQTEVTVYQVGRLGTFARRELELRPGIYTVVGSRPGYRDVRRQLKIEPGATPEPLEIRCEEKI